MGSPEECNGNSVHRRKKAVEDEKNCSTCLFSREWKKQGKTTIVCSLDQYSTSSFWVCENRKEKKMNKEMIENEPEAVECEVENVGYISLIVEGYDGHVNIRHKHKDDRYCVSITNDALVEITKMVLYWAEMQK